MRNLKVLLIALGLLFSGAQSAMAHAELVMSFPKSKSTLVTAPKYVQLKFGEDLATLRTAKSNSIEVFDAIEHKIKTSKISIKNSTAQVEILEKLHSGKYLVKYRVVSADGHVLNSQFTFTLR
jgi:methionine-rich copper-binding protein CopC